MDSRLSTSTGMDYVSLTLYSSCAYKSLVVGRGGIPIYGVSRIKTDRHSDILEPVVHTVNRNVSKGSLRI